MSLVIDASALVELLLRRETAAPVSAGIATGDAVAPQLLDAEVANSLAGLERGRVLDAAGAELALEILADAPIERVEHGGLLGDAWALRHNLSLYDAFYVALAQRLACTLITADRRLANSPLGGVPVTLVAT